jgi:hypothetical protein
MNKSRGMLRFASRRIAKRKQSFPMHHSLAGQLTQGTADSATEATSRWTFRDPLASMRAWLMHTLPMPR